ncbi:MAG: peptidase domain-containing ABC transporter [Cyanobacteria bacterium P01_D01_bin.156]
MRRKKYECVRQHGYEDCGAACMATVAKSYGRALALSEAREAVGVGALGTTLLGLRRGGEALGFKARQVRASKELLSQLSTVPLPAIIHWKGCHWVVLHGQRRAKYIIADPAVGLRWLNQQELMAAWDGIMLLLEPDEIRFYSQAKQQKVTGVPSPLRRLWPYRKLLLESLGLNVAIGLIALVIPFLIQILTDDILIDGDRRMLTIFALGAGVLTLFSTLLEWIQRSLVVYVAQRFELSFTLDFGRQLLQLPLTYFETRNSGEVSARLQDIQIFNRLLLKTLVLLPSEGFTAIVALILMGVYSPILTLWALGLAAAILAPIVIAWPTYQQRARTQLVMAGENLGLLVETFKGAMTLKSINAYPQLLDELQRRLGRLAKYNFETLGFNMTLSLIAKLMIGLDTIVMLWLGGTLVNSQQISVGQLLAVYSLNRTLTLFLLRLVEWGDEFAQVRAVTARILDIIETKPEQRQFAASVELSEATDGVSRKQGTASLPFVEFPMDVAITCTDVSFCYGGRMDLLQDFSVAIPGGKTTALIGESGCGKSTLVKLISGLYSPKSGNIAFGPYSCDDVALDCLRQQVRLVPQDAHFWQRSILENFQLTNPHLSFEEIVDACQRVQAHGFISQLPNKYQTVLGEYGSNLSGGQKQRLAIARALINQPAVLILDESTSALDPIAETNLLNTLADYRQGKTTLMISHRPQVISRADWIIFLEQGKVKRVGPPQELLKTPGSHRYFLEHC